jgi:hypothetical protein
MPTISHIQVPCGCEVRTAEVQLGLLRLEADITQETLVRRLETTQSAMARSERGRHRTSLESISHAGSPLGDEMAIVVEQKRPV